MKKHTVLLIIVSLIGLGFLGINIVQAQDLPAPRVNPAFDPIDPPGPRSGSQAGESGIFHNYMVSAVAEAFGITVEEVENIHQEGLRMWDWAMGEGYAWEEFQEIMLSAREAALQGAVEDGAITQAHADWMMDHMNARGGRNQNGSGPCGRSAGTQNRPLGGMHRRQGQGRW